MLEVFTAAAAFVGAAARLWNAYQLAKPSGEQPGEGKS